jgi:hypothetical protein
MDWRPHAGPPGGRVLRVAGLGLLVAALGLVADTLLLPLAVRGFVNAIELIMNGCVWLALSLSAGISAWSILGTVGEAIEGLITGQRASAALALLVAVGVLAAYGLQRVLGFSGRELGYSAESDAHARATARAEAEYEKESLR